MNLYVLTIVICNKLCNFDTATRFFFFECENFAQKKNNIIQSIATLYKIFKLKTQAKVEQIFGKVKLTQLSSDPFANKSSLQQQTLPRFPITSTQPLNLIKIKITPVEKTTYTYIYNIKSISIHIIHNIYI